ncbi:MAG: glycosyltransferase family 4 protein, partial [Pirellulales bacterium]|nr:glycosyltransferase family 4 protein [Pirellulales bacterium]
FLEKLTPPHYQQARRLLRERAAEVHAFVALNHYYADFMTDYLSVERKRVHVIPHGLRLEGHGDRPLRDPGEPLRIGYLARICEDKGLHLLVEACELLIHQQGLGEIELHAAGYLGAGDRGYFRQIQRSVRQGPLADRFVYHGELDRKEKIAFLQSLSVFSTPTLYRESKGLPLLEAWANAAPAVVPNHGAYPELIADTGGGLLCQPDHAEDLALLLAELLRNPERAREMGRAARQAIRQRYHSILMAERTKSLYVQVSRDSMVSPGTS